MPVRKDKVKKQSRPLDEEDVAIKTLAYISYQEKVKELNKQIADLKKELTQVVEEHGTEEVKTGHRHVIVTHAGNDVTLTLEKRTAVFQETNIKDVLKEGVSSDVYKRCIDRITVVRDEIVNGFAATGDIPEEVLDKMYGSKESFAFKAKNKPTIKD